MSRRISGFYGWRGVRKAPPAPYVDDGLGPGRRPPTVAFLIDTGADITTLGPRGVEEESIPWEEFVEKYWSDEADASHRCLSVTWPPLHSQ